MIDVVAIFSLFRYAPYAVTLFDAPLLPLLRLRLLLCLLLMRYAELLLRLYDTPPFAIRRHYRWPRAMSAITLPLRDVV